VSNRTGSLGTSGTTPSRTRAPVRVAPGASVASRARLITLALLALLATSAAACSSTRADHDDADDDHAVGTVAQPLNSGFRLPFKCGFNTTVTQGNDSAFSHNGAARYGFDFGVVLNTQLVASKAGVVSFARNDVKPGNPCYSGGGPGCISTLNYVTINHGDGTSTLYAHLNSVSVVVGQTVGQGQPVGLSGGTGYSTGPHTHLQRQQNCGAFVCNSIPMSFDDVAGNGVPVGGQAVKSQNSCAGVDCALGDGHYCGGNGVKGDTKSLFFCTAGIPKKVESCTYGCKAMPPGIDDRCATQAEAPPSDAGAEASPDAEPPTAPPATEPPAPTGEPTSDTTSAPAPLADEPGPPAADASSCAVTRATTATAATRSVVPSLALAAAALAVVAGRRRRRSATR
jgi:hypothetical protein